MSTMTDMWAKVTAKVCGKNEPDSRYDADGEKINEAASSRANEQEIVVNPHHYDSLIPTTNDRKKYKRIKQG